MQLTRVVVFLSVLGAATAATARAGSADAGSTDAAAISLPAARANNATKTSAGVRTGAGRAAPGLTSSPAATAGIIPTASWQVEGDQANAGMGSVVRTAGDVNGDGYSDILVGAVNWDGPEQDEGKVWLYLGSASGPVASSWSAEGNQPGAYLGTSMSPAGDVNGDGYGDVVIGVPYYSNGQSSEGRLLVYFGSASGLGASPGWTYESNTANLLAGWNVATAGDVNGDGFDDILMGTINYSNGQSFEGRAFLFMGSASGPAATPAWTYESNQTSAFLGDAVAACDVNGDGYSDVLVGATFYTNGESQEGRTFLFLGSATGLPATATQTLEINSPSAFFGSALSPAGDVNGDGYADVLVGAKGYDGGQTDEGRVLLYAGTAAGLNPTPIWSAESNNATALYGYSVCTAGDIDGDGYADIIIGAPTYDGSQLNNGKVYIYRGGPTGPDPLGQSLSRNVAGLELGYSVAAAGDVDGDGYGDVLVGAVGYTHPESNEGQALLYRGAPTFNFAETTFLGPDNELSAHNGWIVRSAGDVNGDGADDLIVTEPQANYSASNVGRGITWVLTWPFNPNGFISGHGNVGLPGEHFGQSADGAGDINGDGFADIVSAAPDALSGLGKIWVRYSSSSGALTLGRLIVGTSQSSALGTHVSHAGDVNGDGYADFLVSARVDSTTGVAFLYGGSSAGPSAGPVWSATCSAIPEVAAAGDVNGDGFSDVLVAVAGRVDLYEGSPAGLSAAPNWTANGSASDLFGYSISGAGDVNADGYDDILIGAPLYGNGETEEGRALIYLGSMSGPGASPSWTYEPNLPSLRLGWSVAAAGDVDGDGRSDVILGAPGSFGSAYIFSGNGNLLWDQSGNLDEFGWSVAGIGDFNGDGFADVAVGSPALAHAVLGQAHLYFGSGTGAMTSMGLPIAGVARRTRMTRADGVTPIAVLGSTDASLQLRLQQTARTAAGRGRVAMQYEIRPSGTPFDVSGAVRGPYLQTSAPDSLGSSVQTNELASGLASSGTYHWRLRAVSGSPFFPHSPWRSPSSVLQTKTHVRTPLVQNFAGNTPQGTNVAVPLGPATLTFANVSQQGTSALQISSLGPVPPAGLQAVPHAPPLYYDFTTTAAFTNGVQVCVTYDPNAVQGVEGNLHLMHWTGSAWEEVASTVDTGAHRICGTATSLSPFVIAAWNPTDVAATPAPPQFRLLPNVPNPFNPSTQVRYELAAREPVQLTIYDVRGQVVRQVVERELQSPGRHAATWNGRSDAGKLAASGVYFVRLATPSQQATRRIVLLK